MIAGMDVSGDPKSGNHKFMAIVIGTDEKVNALTSDLGSKPIHMKNLRKSDRNAVMNRVKFDGTEIAGFCIHLEKDRALSTVMEHLAKKDKQSYDNRKKLSRTCHALMWEMIRDPLESFLLLHGCVAQDLVFQCDADCRGFASDRGWRHENCGPAYSLADILAWGNSHGREPTGTMSLDIADRLEEQTLKRFK